MMIIPPRTKKSSIAVEMMEDFFIQFINHKLSGVQQALSSEKILKL